MHLFHYILDHFHAPERPSGSGKSGLPQDRDGQGLAMLQGYRIFKAAESSHLLKDLKRKVVSQKLMRCFIIFILMDFDGFRHFKQTSFHVQCPVFDHFKGLLNAQPVCRSTDATWIFFLRRAPHRRSALALEPDTTSSRDSSTKASGDPGGSGLRCLGFGELNLRWRVGQIPGSDPSSVPSVPMEYMEYMEYIWNHMNAWTGFEVFPCPYVPKRPATLPASTTNHNAMALPWQTLPWLPWRQWFHWPWPLEASVSSSTCDRSCSSFSCDRRV